MQCGLSNKLPLFQDYFCLKNADMVPHIWGQFEWSTDSLHISTEQKTRPNKQPGPTEPTWFTRQKQHLFALKHTHLKMCTYSQGRSGNLS